MVRNFLITGRVILGLIFITMGANGIFHFMKVPPMPPGAMALIESMIQTHYLWSFLKILEIVCGALLLINFFVPLALTILAPIIGNIFLFHLFLDPKNSPMGFVLVGLEIFLVWGNWRYFRSMFLAKD